jgi:hypothetical protein
LPAAHEYSSAETALSNAYQQIGNSLAACQTETDSAVRRACEAAVAIDALADRAEVEIGTMSKAAIRSAVSALTIIGTYHRQGALERVAAAANAYKHGSINANRHPITSFGDVLAVGAGYGVDGYGIGKYSGVEVILNLTNGTQRKFLGDLPYSIAGWFAFLKAKLAGQPIVVCNLQVYP